MSENSQKQIEDRMSDLETRLRELEAEVAKLKHNADPAVLWGNQLGD